MTRPATHFRADPHHTHAATPPSQTTDLSATAPGDATTPDGTQRASPHPRRPSTTNEQTPQRFPVSVASGNCRSQSRVRQSHPEVPHVDRPFLPPAPATMLWPAFEESAVTSLRGYGIPHVILPGRPSSEVFNPLYNQALYTCLLSCVAEGNAHRPCCFQTGTIRRRPHRPLPSPRTSRDARRAPPQSPAHIIAHVFRPHFVTAAVG
jgi:hypothetical protein